MSNPSPLIRDMVTPQHISVMWPHLEKIYAKWKTLVKGNINFKYHLEESIKCTNKLRSYLTAMSKKFFRRNELSYADLADFDDLFLPKKNAHIMNFYFLKEELISLFAMDPLSPDCNLTHVYYSKKLLPYLQQRYLKELWQAFMRTPKERHLLEWTATIVTQWYQPQKRIYHEGIQVLLDNIAHQVLEKLRKKNRTHPIFSASVKQFFLWRCQNIIDTQWNNEEETQIINVLRYFLFYELGFRVLVTDPEIFNRKPEDILIDYVLENKTGNVISLAVIFQSVARRLGVRCDLISFSTEILLRWKPKCNMGKFENEECFYIDVQQHGAIWNKNVCPIQDFNEQRPIEIDSPELVLRIINYIDPILLSIPLPDFRQDINVRALLELGHMIKPQRIDIACRLANYYIDNHINVYKLKSMLRVKQRKNELSDQEKLHVEEFFMTTEINQFYMNMGAPSCVILNKRRDPKAMKYSVGMIVTCNINYVTNRTGVIIGWDKIYNSIMAKSLRYRVVFYSNLSDAIETQPFYFILSEDGNTYYACEGSLVKTQPKWIEHREIGRYFYKFALTCYVPNATLLKYYPNL